jgi:acyl-CoA dehydrogenase
MKALRLATEWIRSALAEDQQQAAAASSLYQRLMGHVVGNYLLARGAAAAQEALAAGDNPQFHEAKLVTARFFAEQLLPQGTALLTAMRSTAATAMALSEEQF